VLDGPTLLGVALDIGTPLELVACDAGSPLDGDDEALARRAAAQGARLFALPPGTLARVTDTVTPQGLLALAERPSAGLDDVVAAAKRARRPVVVLAGVADPGNAGTIVRSAEAAGAAGVVFSGGVDPYGPKTVRASAGAILLLPVVEQADLRGVLVGLGDAHLRRIGLAAHGGTPLDAADLRAPLGLVLGSETHGLPEGLERVLDEVLTIPLDGRTESLNVAMAATLALFEAARQRRLS
jgi:TrmH family RNA methyltransferase